MKNRWVSLVVLALAPCWLLSHDPFQVGLREAFKGTSSSAHLSTASSPIWKIKLPN